MSHGGGARITSRLLRCESVLRIGAGFRCRERVGALAIECSAEQIVPRLRVWATRTTFFGVTTHSKEMQ